MTAESEGRRASNSSSHNSAGTETGDELEQDQSSLCGSRTSLKSGPIFINFSGSFTANQITIQIGDQNQTNIQPSGRSSSPNIYVGVTPQCFSSPLAGKKARNVKATETVESDTASAIYMDMSGSSNSSQISQNSTVSSTSGHLVNTLTHRDSFNLETSANSRSRPRIQDLETDGEVTPNTLPIPNEYINGALDNILGFRNDIKFNPQDDSAALRKVCKHFLNYNNQESVAV